MQKYKVFYILITLAIAGLFLIEAGMPVQAAPPVQLTPFFTPTPGADGRIIYIVQPGDTLWRISAITGVNLDDLRALNKLGLNDLITPGDQLLIGLAGPALATSTAGPSPTPLPASPTPTPLTSTAELCVLLYNDQNGDALRQDDEPVLARGAISIINQSGTVSRTSNTNVPVENQCADAYGDPTGFVLFEGLQVGEYNISVAIPEGYNRTTTLNRSVILSGGDVTYLSFGAQPNVEKLAETAVIPETPNRSPVLAIIGGVVLLFGVGLGVYAWLLNRAR